MLTGFEDITYELTDTEKELVPIFLKGFQKHIGKRNAITNNEIIKRLSIKYKNITEARVRKIINYIRNEGLLPGLAAFSGGYYITNDANDIRRYIQSLAGRENAIHKVKNSMIRYLKELEA